MATPFGYNANMTEELAIRLQRPDGAALRQALLQRLQTLQAQLLQQLGGGGMGVAWASQLAAADVQSIQSALAAVRAGIEILQALDVTSFQHTHRK